MPKRDHHCLKSVNERDTNILEDPIQIESYTLGMRNAKILGVTFHEYMSIMEKMEFEYVDHLTNCAILKSSNSRLVEPKRFSLTELTIKPSHINDISLLENSEFWIFFHLTRKTFRALVDDITSIALNIDQNLGNTYSEEVSKMPVNLMIQMCLWYLRNADDSLEEGMKLFSLNSLELLEDALKRGFRLISYLKAETDMCWPSRENFLESAHEIANRFHVNNVCGIIVNRIFTAVNRKRLLLQVICNENQIIKEGIVTFDTRPHVAIAIESDFFLKLKEVPQGLKLVGDDKYNTLPKYLRMKDMMMTPAMEPQFPVVKGFGLVHEAILSIGERSVQCMVDRFPRLEKLHNAFPEAIIAACVLHNYSIKHEDLAPFVSSPMDGSDWCSGCSMY